MGFALAKRQRYYGGSCEIRTHGGDKPSPVFKTGALNRSAKLPLRYFNRVRSSGGCDRLYAWVVVYTHAHGTNFSAQ